VTRHADSGEAATGPIAGARSGRGAGPHLAGREGSALGFASRDCVREQPHRRHLSELPVVLLLGRTGQVGWEVERLLAGRAALVAPDETVLDLRDEAALRAGVRKAAPAAIIKAAGYTAVDRAEEEPDVAHAVNAVAPGVLAEEAARGGALLVHYSTDYVFDGAKGAPYVEDDAPSPPDVVGAGLLEVRRRLRLPAATLGRAARGDDGGAGRKGVGAAAVRPCGAAAPIGRQAPRMTPI